MRIQDVDLEIIKGDGSDLKVDVVALESVEDYPIDGGEVLSVIGGEGHYYTLIANLSFSQTVDDVDKVRRGYADVLRKSAELDAKSIALIPLGYEKGVITPEASAKILAQELLKFIRFGRHNLEKVYVCVADVDNFDIVNNAVIGYLTHIQDTLGMGPYVTVDAIIEFSDGIVIIDRVNPPYGWALPGGFVDYGESLEAAVLREVEEETGLSLEDLRQFKTYSAPDRDPRFHTISTVFIGRGVGEPKAGDDAKNLKIVPYDDLMKGKYAFDHKQVIGEYLKENVKR